MFQEMMDRIEDETIKYLFFMRIETGDGGGPAAPPLPYPELGPDADEEDEEDENEPELVTANVQAQQSVIDLTRNIQRKKDRELAELQFSGGEAASQPKTVTKTAKVGRNELCPCGSGKKYKKCHGVNS